MKKKQCVFWNIMFGWIFIMLCRKVWAKDRDLKWETNRNYGLKEFYFYNVSSTRRTLLMNFKTIEFYLISVNRSHHNFDGWFFFILKRVWKGILKEISKTHKSGSRAATFISNFFFCCLQWVICHPRVCALWFAEK